MRIRRITVFLVTTIIGTAIFSCSRKRSAAKSDDVNLSSALSPTDQTTNGTENANKLGVVVTGSGTYNIQLTEPTAGTLTIAADGTFYFPNELLNATSFSVEVGTIPSGFYCDFSSLAGTFTSGSTISMNYSNLLLSASDATDGDVVNLSTSLNLTATSDLTYQWSVKSGLDLKISNAHSLNATVTIPEFIGDYIQTLTLVVTKNSETILTEDVTFNLTDDKNYGYQSRPCGFDLDQDGLAGEVGECNVCNPQFTDIDGDSNPEDIFYVDTVSGSNVTGDGSAGNPYATIQHALDQGDGGGNGVQDVVCFYGTDTGTILPPNSGASVSEPRGFLNYPKKPIIIAGWDKDEDGEYPPYDTDDLAVIDGATAGVTAFDLDNSPQANLEFAHFTITNYTNHKAFEATSESNTGIFIHDIFINNFNSGLADSTNRLIFSFYGTDIMIENNDIADVCCTGVYLQDADDYNISNNSFQFSGFDYIEGMRFWGSNNGIVSRNHMDSGIPSWTQADGIDGLNIHKQTTNVFVRENRLHNFVNPFYVSVWSSGLYDSDNINIERNLVTGDVDPGFANYGVRLSLSDVGFVINNINIYNNIFNYTGTATLDYCLSSTGADNTVAVTGTAKFIGNTCNANTMLYGIYITAGETHKRNDWVFKNNIFNGVTTNNIYTGYGPTGFVENGNIYSSVSNSFRWAGGAGNTLSNFKTASSNAASISKECTPTFVNSLQNNFELTSSDTCARASGVDITADDPLDFLSRARKTTSPSSGAFETP